MKRESIFFWLSFFSLFFINCRTQGTSKGPPTQTSATTNTEQPILIPGLQPIQVLNDLKNLTKGVDSRTQQSNAKSRSSPTPIQSSVPNQHRQQQVATTSNVAPNANTAQNTMPIAVPAPVGNNMVTPLQQPAEGPPSSGSPNPNLPNIPQSSPQQNTKPDDASKIAWKEDEKLCIVVSGPPNTTNVQPMTVQRISWNQSPCQMSGRIVAKFDISLYNNLQIATKVKKRDFTPNGKLQYDWGPYPIAHDLSNTTNNFDWKVPSIYNARITNTSKFFIRVETISLSGIFGAQPPLGGTYGPFSMVLGDPTEQSISDPSIASSSGFISILNINLGGLFFSGVLLAIITVL